MSLCSLTVCARPARRLRQGHEVRAWHLPVLPLLVVIGAGGGSSCFADPVATNAPFPALVQRLVGSLFDAEITREDDEKCTPNYFLLTWRCTSFMSLFSSIHAFNHQLETAKPNHTQRHRNGRRGRRSDSRNRERGSSSRSNGDEFSVPPL